MDIERVETQSISVLHVHHDLRDFAFSFVCDLGRKENGQDFVPLRKSAKTFVFAQGVDLFNDLRCEALVSLHLQRTEEKKQNKLSKLLREEA